MKNDKEIVPATTKIAVFRGKEVRKTIHNDEWWFVIEDVVALLTDSIDPKGYIKDMRRRDEELAKEWGQIATPFRSHHSVRFGPHKGRTAPALCGAGTCCHRK
jgi:prophage antirepressor-like protein